jgi:hypothetical protein
MDTSINKLVLGKKNLIVLLWLTTGFNFINCFIGN